MANVTRLNLVESVLVRSLPTSICASEAFQAWYDPIGDAVQCATLEVYEEVEAALAAEEDRILKNEYGHREVWRLFPPDGGGLTKSVASVRSKIARVLLQEVRTPEAEPRVLTESDVRQMVLGFADLGRFRVVCGYPADVETALNLLLPDRGGRLLGRYPLKDGVFKDYVFDLELRKLVKGHRARQFAVQVPAEDGALSVCVEIQFMTMLQHAYDRRNHPIYEWTREGGALPPEMVVNDLAVAETLHLADQQAGRNWDQFLRHVQASPRTETT